VAPSYTTRDQPICDDKIHHSKYNFSLFPYCDKFLGRCSFQCQQSRTFGKGTLGQQQWSCSTFFSSEISIRQRLSITTSTHMWRMRKRRENNGHATNRYNQVYPSTPSNRAGSGSRHQEEGWRPQRRCWSLDLSCMTHRCLRDGGGR